MRLRMMAISQEAARMKKNKKKMMMVNAAVTAKALHVQSMICPIVMSSHLYRTGPRSWNVREKARLAALRPLVTLRRQCTEERLARWAWKPV